LLLHRNLEPQFYEDDPGIDREFFDQRAQLKETLVVGRRAAAHDIFDAGAVGDVVNQLMRPAGILIPDGAGRKTLQAGFGQIEAQVMNEGMVAEATCISKPWVIIPMVVTTVQDYIAAGQFRSGEQLLEAENTAKPGTILVFLEPLYKGGLEGVTPGSSCIVNAYTSNHEEIVGKDTGTGRAIALHVVDGVGLVHALLLRIEALLLPIKTLVLAGH
jgi:hypothetical protein